jgi:hypothetical protein
VFDDDGEKPSRFSKRKKTQTNYFLNGKDESTANVFNKQELKHVCKEESRPQEDEADIAALCKGLKKVSLAPTKDEAKLRWRRHLAEIQASETGGILPGHKAHLLNEYQRRCLHDFPYLKWQGNATASWANCGLCGATQVIHYDTRNDRLAFMADQEMASPATVSTAQSIW